MVVTRAERFRELCATKPCVESVLASKSGSPVPVHVDIRSTGKRMFCNAVIDEACTGWYLTSENTGLKCLLTRKAQGIVEENNKGFTNLRVERLQVVRQSRNGRALICEVANGT